MNEAKPYNFTEIVSALNKLRKVTLEEYRIEK
jgi:hypothetical protein